MSLIFPYLTLQALGLGLTYEDISIIYGISPVIALAAGPIAGERRKIWDRGILNLMKNFFLQSKGFIGDLIGYRVVLIVNVIVVGVCATVFNFLPVYKETEQVPHALLYMNMSAAESAEMSYSLMTIQWPICDDSFTISKL